MFSLVANMRDHKRKGERGFSLVELLVVVAILAILAAIAIPLFLNQKQKAYESSASSDLHTIVMELNGDTTWNAMTSATLTAAFTYTAATDILSMPGTNLIPATAISIPNVVINSSSTVQGGIIAGTTFNGQSNAVVTNADTTHGWCISVTNNGQTAVYGVRSVAGGNAVAAMQSFNACSAAGVMS